MADKMVYCSNFIHNTTDVTHNFWGQGDKTLRGWLYIDYFAYRKSIDDPTLRICLYKTGVSPLNTGYAKVSVYPVTTMNSTNYYARGGDLTFKINGSSMIGGRVSISDKTYKIPDMTYTMGTGNMSCNFMYESYGVSGVYTEVSFTNMDEPSDWEGYKASIAEADFTSVTGHSCLGNIKDFGSTLRYSFQVSDHGINFDGVENWTGNRTLTGILTIYPPYVPSGKIIGEDETDPTKKLTNGGASGTKEAIELTSNYKITKRSEPVRYTWNPNGDKNGFGLKMYSDLVVDGTTYSKVSSPKDVNAPGSDGYSYTAKVKRYFDSNSPLKDVSSYDTWSNTLNQYTYSRPTLTGITLSKYTLSPRANTSLRVTLSGANNRKLSVENNFRTGIWSNIKSKYYIDETNTNYYRDLSLSEIKTMFPDTSASNGVVDGTIYTNRRNLGVSNGNPRRK